MTKPPKKSTKSKMTTAEAGSLGGKARAANLSPEQRRASCAKANRARWSRYYAKHAKG